MIVRFASGLRRAGLSVPAFQEHWRTTHAEAVLALEGLAGYVQNHLVLREDGTPWLPWPLTDACAEIEFESVAAMEAAFASPAADQVRADGALFIEPGRGGLSLHARRVLVDGHHPDEGVKLVTALRRFPGVRAETLDAVLAGPYATAVAAGRPLRHEQLIPIDHPANEAAWCDAVDLLWFATPGEAAAFAVSDAAGSGAAALAGHASGCERLVARPVRVR